MLIEPQMKLTYIYPASNEVINSALFLDTLYPLPAGLTRSSLAQSIRFQ